MRARQSGFDYEKDVLNSRRRVQSNLFVILFFILLISVLVQLFVFKSDFKQYFVELIAVIFSGYYLIVGNIRVGSAIFDKDNSRKILLINVILTSFLATLIFSVGYYFNYQEKYQAILNVHFISVIIIFMISMSVVSTVAFILIDLIMFKKKEIKKELESDHR